MSLVKRKQQGLFEQKRNELIVLVEKLKNKLKDPNLTEKQFNAIYSVLQNKLKALKENKVY